MVRAGDDGWRRSSQGGRGVRWLVGGSLVLVVFGAVVGRWLVTPFDDWVPLAPHAELPATVGAEDLAKSARFRCSAAFGEAPSATPSQQALDAQAYQDPTREPCAAPRRQRAVVGVVDLALVAAAFLLMAYRSLALVRPRRRTAPEEATVTAVP